VIINNAHALYANGELIGIIANPDPVPGGIDGILDALSYENPNTSFDAIAIPGPNGWRWIEIAEALKGLGVQTEIEPTPLEDLDDDV
jgi:hypothetical protein